MDLTQEEEAVLRAARLLFQRAEEELERADDSERGRRSSVVVALGLGLALVCGGAALSFYQRPEPAVVTGADAIDCCVVAGSGPCYPLGATGRAFRIDKEFLTPAPYLLDCEGLDAASDYDYALDQLDGGGEQFDDDGGDTFPTVDCFPAGSTSSAATPSASRQLAGAINLSREFSAAFRDAGSTSSPTSHGRGVRFADPEAARSTTQIPRVDCGRVPGRGPCHPARVTRTSVPAIPAAPAYVREFDDNLRLARVPAAAFRFDGEVPNPAAYLLPGSTSTPTADPDAFHPARATGTAATAPPVDGYLLDHDADSVVVDADQDQHVGGGAGKGNMEFPTVECDVTGRGGQCYPVGVTSLADTFPQIMRAVAFHPKFEALPMGATSTSTATADPEEVKKGYDAVPNLAFQLLRAAASHVPRAAADRAAALYPAVDCGVTGRGGPCYPFGATATATPIKGIHPNSNRACGGTKNYLLGLMVIVTAVLVAALTLHQ